MKNNITNISLLRKSNIKNILNILWKNKVTTRRELSNITSITAPTISNIIDILLEKGFIKIKGKGESTGGRHANILPQLEVVLENLISKFDKKDKLVGIGDKFSGNY